MRLKAIQKFIQLESFGGILLFIFTMLALVVSNSSLNVDYIKALNTSLAIHLGHMTLGKPVMHWVNDGLMAIFFFLVGLEIKRELVAGELNTPAKIGLPAIGALGGMVIPAALYFLLTVGQPGVSTGWAIPTATDIAFSLGILSLLGNKVPLSIKTFLTAVAIFDDLGAIVIIALFYTDDISLIALVYASLCLLALYVCNRANVTRTGAYVIIGLILWLCVLKSGVHATLAGVATAFAIPMQDMANPRYKPLQHIEGRLHPWVAYFILPVFAFANAGIDLHKLSLTDLVSPLPLGIASGLFLGKQVGIFGACWLAVRYKMAKLPSMMSWQSLYGISLLCGVGFTMSLFIGTLAFEEVTGIYPAWVRLGVLVGSTMSGVAGFLVLRNEFRGK